MMNVTVEKVRGAVFGAAVGDAVGVPFEFTSPEQMKRRPAVDMVGGGTYHLPAGTWSDDTTMILCTLDRLDESKDYDAIMKAFLSWVNEGKYTPYGDCFDIGNTTRSALMNYARGSEPLHSGLDDAYSNGNGSLMRIIPAALYADAHRLTADEAVSLAHELSSLTHAHLRSRMGCGIFTCIAMCLLKYADKSSVTEGLQLAGEIYSAREYSQETKKYARLFSSSFGSLPEGEIRSSGYVLDTLECAVWSLLNTESYRECILKAVNFGKDTDTAACVAGALAGLLYGTEGIPERWREALAGTEFIGNIVSGFCERNNIV
ncbi:MAG: ADP-ribosylglycohydrolase family protein [Clostridia bacterium]|nr:ADP-ribosylglycohydrolase family protein [Clostridia bacterium]